MNENFFKYQHPEDPEDITVCGIPFSVTRDQNGAVAGLEQEKMYDFSASCDVLFFLGMTVEFFGCSEWWGSYEAQYDHSMRVYIGDRMKNIIVEYEDMTEELIFVHFGVNAWNYNIYYKSHDYEKCRYGWNMMQEPFASDPSAKALLDKSLKLMENTDPSAEKRTKFVFCYRLRPGKKIKTIRFREAQGKYSDIAISAVTGLKTGAPIDPAWPLVDEDFFMRREYFADADRLARRLYQFKDDLPKSDPKKEIEGFAAPDITFTGAPLAEIYTNVYRMNITDMVENKVSEDGHAHTSSPVAANFGGYMGFGTYKIEHGGYSNHVWSRDIGRLMMELTNYGCGEKLKSAVDYLHSLLYYRSNRFPIPHWKRVANWEIKEGEITDMDGNENDGHGSLMLFMYSLYRKGIVDLEWLRERKQALKDAADYFIWQKEHPEESVFNEILFSMTESSSQRGGAYDVFSNVLAAYGLIGYSRIFRDLGEEEYAKTLADLAEQLQAGIQKRFGMEHPRYGKVLADINEGGYTYGYKRMCYLMLHGDLYGYDMAADDPELFDLMTRTFLTQKEEYYAPESGRQMGYGQGYLTQSVIMLDLYEELTACVEAAAMFCYHHSDCNYIVPEGVIMHGSKRFWFRSADQGNGVQQAETVKCARLLLGIDDIMPERGLRLIPRLPLGWQSLQAEDYKVTTKDRRIVPFSFKYQAGAAEGKVVASDAANAYTADWSGDAEVEILRVGPFKTQDITVTGGAVTEIKKIQDNYFAYVKPY